MSQEYNEIDKNLEVYRIKHFDVIMYQCKIVATSMGVDSTSEGNAFLTDEDCSRMAEIYRIRKWDDIPEDHKIGFMKDYQYDREIK